jgi:hypothetical protein
VIFPPPGREDGVGVTGHRVPRSTSVPSGHFIFPPPARDGGQGTPGKTLLPSQHVFLITPPSILFLPNFFLIVIIKVTHKKVKKIQHPF